MNKNKRSFGVGARVGAAILLSALVGVSAFGAEREIGGKRYAVLVGINDYADAAILKLSTARNDAVDLGRTLSDAGWDKVFVLRDDVDFRDQDFPNRTNIENRVQLLADLVTSDDTIFFFFSGHGMSSGDAPYILPVDASLNRLAETSIPLASLVSAFTSSGLHRIVVAVDACREQVAVTKGLSVVGITDSGGGGSSALTLFATKAGWYSYEDERGKNGVFTRFLLQGLAGEADGTDSSGVSDGSVTFAEIAAWLPDAVASYALDKGIRQKAVAVRGSGDATALAVPVATSRVRPAAAAPQTLAAEAEGDLAEERLERPEQVNRPDRPYRSEEAPRYGFAIFQLSLTDGLQLCPSRYTIGGVAVGAIGTRNDAVYGIQAALFPKTDTMRGVQAGVIPSADSMIGLQAGVIIHADTVAGLQYGVINKSEKTLHGGQVGLINTADDVYGAQIGLINKARTLHGVQIGLLNTVTASAFFGRFMLGCNIGF